MRIGFSLPHLGTLASPEAIVRAARRAEELGYDSVWTVDRTLYPIRPQTPYPAKPDGRLPDCCRINYDPLDTLTYAAAHTKRIALGTSVLDIPYYNPVLLARRLSTIDVLSGGRLRVGLGLGWSKDEYEAAGATFEQRGSRADEFLQVLKAIWTTDPVEYQGRFYRVPLSIIQPKPVQKPHPPIYLAAFAPAALERAAKYTNGWNPVLVPLDGMAQMFAGLRQMAQAAGRDPAEMQLLVRANLEIGDAPLGPDRAIFTGSLDQIREDIEGCRRLGAHELIFDPLFSPDGESLDRFFSRMEQMRSMV